MRDDENKKVKKELYDHATLFLGQFEQNPAWPEDGVSGDQKTGRKNEESSTWKRRTLSSLTQEAMCNSMAHCTMYSTYTSTRMHITRCKITHTTRARQCMIERPSLSTTRPSGQNDTATQTAPHSRVCQISIEFRCACTFINRSVCLEI